MPRNSRPSAPDGKRRPEAPEPAAERARSTAAQRLAAARGPAGDRAALDGPGSPLPPNTTWTGTARRLHEVALLLFAERGFHAVSVRDLTNAVGINPSSLYAHVASKADLLTDLIRLGHEEHRDCLRQALLDAGSDPGDQIEALARAHVRMHADYPLLTRVANRELSALTDAAYTQVAATRLESEQMFMNVVERGQQLGEFTDVDPFLATAAIAAMGLRISEWWRSDLGLDVNTVVDTYAHFARQMLR